MSPKKATEKEIRRLLGRIKAGYMDGRITVAELRALAERPSREELPRILEKIIAGLEKAAKETADIPLKAGVLAILACIRHEDGVVDELFHEIFQMQNGDRARAIAVIVHTLADLEKLGMAREVNRRNESAYYRTEGWCAIASVSCERQDIEEADTACGEINNPDLKRNAEGEIAHIKKEHVAAGKKSRRRHLSQSFHRRLVEAEVLNSLLESLIRIQGFSKTQARISEFQSAKERIMAQAMLGLALAKLIRL